MRRIIYDKDDNVVIDKMNGKKKVHSNDVTANERVVKEFNVVDLDLPRRY